jgi:hypothetical protein
LSGCCLLQQLLGFDGCALTAGCCFDGHCASIAIALTAL